MPVISCFLLTTVNDLEKSFELKSDKRNAIDFFLTTLEKKL